MTAKLPGQGARRFPLDLDTRDPEGIADFTLGLGYDIDQVVTTVERRCSLDHSTARRIVKDVAARQTKEV